MFEYLGDVGGGVGFLDVMRLRDGGVGVPKLGGGMLGVQLPVEQGGDGLAEAVRGDPLKLGSGDGVAQLAAEVVRRTQRPGMRREHNTPWQSLTAQRIGRRVSATVTEAEAAPADSIFGTSVPNRPMGKVYQW